MKFTKTQLRKMVITGMVIDMQAKYVTGTTNAHGVGSPIPRSEWKKRQAKLRANPGITKLMEKIATKMYDSNNEVAQHYVELLTKTLK